MLFRSHGNVLLDYLGVVKSIFSWQVFGFAALFRRKECFKSGRGLRALQDAGAVHDEQMVASILGHSDRANLQGAIRFTGSSKKPFF